MTIEFIQRPHGREVTCNRCGAVIADWAKVGNEFTTTRPNQDRHREWHEEVDHILRPIPPDEPGY